MSDVDVVTPDRLDALIEASGEHLVSIYMPTHRAGPETRQDPIRLKNLLREADERLAALGVDAPNGLLADLRSRVDDYGFWQHQAGGLALFAGPDGTSEIRLPAPFDELVVVGERFHVKPLIPALDTGRVFFVLALSENEVRLLQGTRSSVSEVSAEGLPESLAEALWFEDPEKTLQSHSVSRGGGQATFHGHGLGEDDTADRRRRFLRVVDDGVGHLVAGSGAPLVLAGTERNQAAYKEVTQHPAVLEEGITGNPEDLSAEELHERAWALVSARADGGRAESAERFAALAGTGRTATGAGEVALAAVDGRVADLFVARSVPVWGRFDPGERVAQEHDERQPGDRDLADAAAAATWRNGGQVYVVDDLADVPGGGPVAAVYRY